MVLFQNQRVLGANLRSWHRNRVPFSRLDRRGVSECLPEQWSPGASCQDELVSGVFSLRSAGGFELDNLCMILDRNCMQVEGHTDKVVRMDPIADKFAAFRWNTIEINGNAMNEVVRAFEAARNFKGKPSLIVANTLAGAGVPFLEGQLSHLARLNDEDARRAMEALAEPAR